MSLTFAELEYFFSSQRLQRYLTACSADGERAAELYKANIRISQSFHPLLCILETALRNRLNSTLAVYFGDSEWILNQRGRFMSDPSLGYKYFLREEVERTASRLRRAGYTVNSGKIIADLNFGFWSALFEPKHFTLLQGNPLRIFNGLPSTKRRIDVYNNLSQIRDFRNRISHNEPICFNGNIVSFENTIDTYKVIRRTIRWVDIRLLLFLNEFNSTIKEIKTGLNI